MLLVALIGVLVALFSVGLGLLVSNFARSPNAAEGAVLGITLPMCALGGLWWPVEMMPQYMQTIAHALPTTHAMNAFRGVIMRGEGLLAIASPVLVLLGFAIAVLAIGLWLFKWEE